MLEQLLAELVAELKTLNENLKAQPVAAPAPVEEKPKPKAKRKKAAPKPEPQPEIQTELELVVETKAADPEPVLTAADLNEKLMAILQVHPELQEQIVAHMGSKGGQRISQIDPEHYGDILYFSQRLVAEKENG